MSSWAFFVSDLADFLVSPACAGTSWSCEEASSEFVLSTCSAPPGHAFITVAGFKEVGLNWCIAITVGSTMVGAVPLTAFTCDELLAERLADRSAPRFVGLSAPCPATVVAFACALAGSSVNPLRGIDPTKVVSLVMSQRTSYLFIDSSTGGERGMEVV